MKYSAQKEPPAILDFQHIWYIIPNMKAEVLLKTKTVDDKGNIVEIKILKVEKTKSEPYGIKYSLVYIEKYKRGEIWM